MEELSLAALEAAAPAYDACVLESDDVDRFCSASDWILPAHHELGAGGAPWLRRSEHGFVALASAEHGAVTVLQPLEAAWGLACPLVGEDAPALAADFAVELRASGPRRAALFLCGLAQGSARFAAIAAALAPTHHLRLGPATRRFSASLEGGVDGFLSRRSAAFRDGLRRARKRAAEAGIGVEHCAVPPDETAAAWQRLLAVEAQSWKGQSGVGIEASQMAGFYRRMIARLAARGALRLSFARREGQDLAYILGGVFGGTYRGLQFSFRAEEERYSLGNLCQLAEIERLAAEGIAVYDLGTEVEYKRRWGEIIFETIALIALPR